MNKIFEFIEEVREKKHTMERGTIVLENGEKWNYSVRKIK